jgi:hypothetical protein
MEFLEEISLRLIRHSDAFQESGQVLSDWISAVA